MKVWQESKWPFQWLGECDNAYTLNKNHASIRCNSEHEAIDFMTENDCCLKVISTTQLVKDNLHQKMADSEKEIIKLKKLLKDSADRSSCLFQEAVEWKQLCTRSTNAGAKLIQERDSAAKQLNDADDIIEEYADTVNRLSEELHEATNVLAVEKLITDRQHEEIIRLKTQILATGIDEVRDRLDKAIKAAQEIEKEWHPYIFPVVPAPKDDSWLKYDH